MSRGTRLSLSLMLVSAGIVMIPAASAPSRANTANDVWSPEERAMLRSLSLSSLGALPPDASNRVADSDAAAELGADLFFDTKFSANGKVSCATCHLPEQNFQDGRPLGIGVGTAGRRTMPIAGTTYSPWQFWDGRADSHWAQALGPLESSVEHGGDRVQYAHVIASDYRQKYDAVFGKLPDVRGLPDRAGPVGDTVRQKEWLRLPVTRQADISELYANIGKAIAAYERRIRFTPSRFDRYVDVVLASKAHSPSDSLSGDERAGLRLFIGKANCATCHNGALLTDNHFHNTGVGVSKDVAVADSGRLTGVRDAQRAEFNCLSRYSDAKPEDCAELRFAVTEGDELLRAYKTPSLRNVVTRAPFMHAGQLGTLREVLDHYNRAPKAPFGKTELKRLRLNDAELKQIEAFLNTLVSPIDAPARKAAR